MRRALWLASASLPFASTRMRGSGESCRATSRKRSLAVMSEALTFGSRIFGSGARARAPGSGIFKNTRHFKSFVEKS